MLGDAAGLAGGNVGLPQGVQKRRLAVIHMADHRNHRRARLKVFICVFFTLNADFHVGVTDAPDFVSEFGDHEFRRIAVNGIVDSGHDVHFY